MSYHLTYLEAVVTGLVQGVTELFPVSSLGHNVLLPALVGGSWASTLNVSAPGSPYLAFIVGLHVATAVGMIAYFWRDWLRIVRGFLSSLRRRQVTTPDQRLAWMIILGTIPVGIVGLALQKVFTNVFAKPELAAAFLAVNGVILLLSERMRRARDAARGAATVSAPVPPVAPAGPVPGWPRAGPGPRGTRSSRGNSSSRGQAPGTGRMTSGRTGAAATAGRATAGRAAAGRARPGAVRAGAGKARGRAGARRAAPGGGKHGCRSGGGRGPAAVHHELQAGAIVGAAQILALLPGISRDGMVTVTGMWRGLRREDAVRFSFLLSAPVILAAGVLKVPDLTGPMAKGMHGPVLVGSLIAGVSAFLSIRFLTKYFSEDKSLNPFGIYCLVAGLGSLAYLVIK